MGIWRCLGVRARREDSDQRSGGGNGGRECSHMAECSIQTSEINSQGAASRSVRDDRRCQRPELPVAISFRAFSSPPRSEQPAPSLVPSSGFRSASYHLLVGLRRVQSTPSRFPLWRR
jgi:hypothetical protein